MEDKDHIKELFKSQLDGFEADVRPDLWNSISSQLPANIPVNTGSVSWLTKSIIAIAGAASVGIAIYLLSPKSSDQTKASAPIEVDSIEGQNKDLQQTEKVLETKSTLVSGDQTVLQAQHINLTDSGFDNQVEKIELIDPIIHSETAQLVTTETEPSTPVANTNEKSDKSVDYKEVQEEKTPTNGDVANEKEEQLYSLTDPVNVFTPNADGVNDYFELSSSGLFEFSIVVLDAQNRTVFSSSDPEFKWDGTLIGGESLPSGNYIYYLTARDKKGNPVTQSSYLRIVR